MKKILCNGFFILFILTICVFKFPAYAQENNTFTGWLDQITDDRMKEWTVQFGDSLNKDTITSDNIYIKDIDGRWVESKLIVSQDDKTVTIKPILPYDTDKKYFIYITSKVKSSENKNLTKEIKMSFIVKPKDDKYEGEKIAGYVVDRWNQNGSVFVEVDNGEKVRYKVEKGSDNVCEENIIVFSKNSNGNIEVADSLDKDFTLYKGKVKARDGKYIIISNGKKENKLKFADNVICYEEDNQKSVSSIKSNSKIKVIVKDNLIQVVKIYENEDIKYKDDEDVINEEKDRDDLSKDKEDVASEEDSDEIVGYVVDRWNENGDLFAKIMYPEINSNDEVCEKTYKVESEGITKDTIIVFTENSDGNIELKDYSYNDFKMYAGEIKDIDGDKINVYDCHDKNKHLLKLEPNTVCFFDGEQIKLSDLREDSLIRVYVKDNSAKVIKIYD
ncbi:Ig-like domain-containing protein [Tepidibacter hydrothermalis]|uniref:SbsA Ig-like domain-containing protein n=1 Tax=Tepidibacter hydrothermalis TaxID=3036126 RepID=A0ABY8ECK1_9FIRM|nr:Ig-like domain-containing protein [Tepidibacter hydrothermalis]WFD10643.1 hypothetical protein P4S50_00795 [Tepidibacter hydrothermalis]